MRMNVCDSYAISRGRKDRSDQYFEKFDQEYLVHLLHGGLSGDVA